MKKENVQTEKNTPSADELKEIARQLAHPDGPRGIDMGHMMNESNIGMTLNAIKQLALEDNDVVLELGHGNANHLATLHQQAKVQYHGLDISATMKREAEKYARKNNLSVNSTFHLYNGTDVPFDNNTFDKIFTVNTLYFWQAPDQLLGALYRTLKPNGLLSIAFVDKATMDTLPFTAYGFTKYTRTAFEELIKRTPFKVLSLEKFEEKIKNKMLEEIARTYFVAVLIKA